MNPSDIRNLFEQKPAKKESPSLAGSILLILGIVGIFILAIFVNFLVFFLLYNYVMPIFGLPKLSFFEASALYFLIWMFVGPVRLNKKEK
jgi:hypothetical protein